MTPLLPWLVAAAGATTASAAPPGSPPPGTYDARLCVTVTRQPTSCGPAEARVRPDGEIRLRVDDIVYLLGFQQSVLVGVTMHGQMQVAEFVSSYRWAGSTLLFGDRERGLQYEVELTRPGAKARASGVPTAR